MQAAGENVSANAANAQYQEIVESGSATQPEQLAEQRRLSARDAGSRFEQCDEPPATFNTIDRIKRFPSLWAEFLRHLLNCRSDRTPPRKLNALLKYVRSQDDDTKFGVVANSIKSLRVIAQFLEANGITCVGAGLQPEPATKASDDASKKRKNDCEAGASSSTGPSSSTRSSNKAPASCRKTPKPVTVNSMTQAAARFSTDTDVTVYCLTWRTRPG